MTKTIFGLCGIPRAGNTLFSSIMNQNPKINATANSPILNIYGGIILQKEDETFQNFPDHYSFDNVMENLAQNFYEHWSGDYIIDRSVWGFPENLDIMKKYLNPNPKIIVLVRDIIEVLASFINFSYSNDANFIARNGVTLEQRCNYVMMEKGPLHKWLSSVYQLINTQSKKYAHMIKYNDLVENPKKEIDAVYDFLDIPKFDHDYTNIPQLQNNGVMYDDTVLGGDLHKIRTDEIKKSSYKVEDILTPHIISKFSNMNFWE